MEVFDRGFLDEMKERFEIDLAGATTIESSGSAELERRVSPLLPTARSVVVFAREIYSEVVDLLRPSSEAGEAHGGDLLPVHSEYLNGRLNRGVHELAEYFRRRGTVPCHFPPSRPPISASRKASSRTSTSRSLRVWEGSDGTAC